MIHARDWSGHPLGLPERWPGALCAALGLILPAPDAMMLCWGPERHVFFNDAFFPLIGAHPSLAMGECLDHVWPDAMEQARAVIEAVMAGDSVRHVDIPWTLPIDGDAAESWWSFCCSRVLDRDGAMAGSLIVANETTARMRTDAALGRSRAERDRAIDDLRVLNHRMERRVAEQTADHDLLATIVQTTDSLVNVLDRDFRWMAMNRAAVDEFERVYGVRPAVGDRILDLLEDWPTHRTEVQRYWGRALAGEEFTAVRTFTRRGESSPRSYEMKFNTLRDPDGAPIGAFQISTDITTRILNAAELDETREALRQSQKMEAVGQLTGGLAHDFNNLLTAITGGLELLHIRLQQGRHDELDRYVAMAQAGANRAAALTQRLLAFSRRQTLAPTIVRIDALVNGMIEIVDRTLGPAIDLHVVAPDDLWPVLVDAPQMENGLLNLCINARDAMPDGGRLTITSANDVLKDMDAIERDLPPGDYVLLCVTDSGQGMPPEIVRRVFEPFFTTKPIGEGTGLGLSMLYGFIRQSGGQVHLQSEVGQGTTICLYLPRHSGTDRPEEAATPRDAVAHVATGATVLVVEDAAAIRSLMSEALGEAGYRVLEAANGADGVAMLRSDIAIDLLVTDVGLPGGLNGRQVADAGRAVRPDLPILFVTGYAASAAVGAGQLEPGMTILTKPFTIAHFTQCVHACIGMPGDM
ncbi:MAG TPA: PAS domain-containing protein [Sphingomonas sp.]|uniref:PAS domain-containing protein n=1 Tax=Sphingomonas sp. TaxID=28214 RepID=UPI002ED951D9